MVNQVDRIDGLVGSIAVKAPVKVATTAAITLSGAQTIDGVALTADESPRQRVLVMDQTDAIENGIYDVNSGDWTRSPDFDGSRDAVDGTQVIVNEGATVTRIYYLSVTDPVVIGTDELAFITYSGDGGPLIYLSGYADLATAVSELGSSVTELWVDADDSSNATIPQTLTLRFIPGNTLSGTVVIASPGNITASRRQQIFDSSATISFTSNYGIVYPDWWGAVYESTPTTAGMTINKDAIQTALNCGAQKVIFNSFFTVNGAITYGPWISMVGNTGYTGHYTSSCGINFLFTASGNTDLFSPTTTSYKTEYENLTVFIDASSDLGTSGWTIKLHMHTGRFTHMRRCFWKNAAGADNGSGDYYAVGSSYEFQADPMGNTFENILKDTLWTGFDTDVWLNGDDQMDLLTLDVAPATDWDANDIITGQTSAETSVVYEKLTDLTYFVRQRTGSYTLGEIIGVTGVGAKLADQGAAHPTVIGDLALIVGMDITGCAFMSLNTSNTDADYANVRINGGRQIRFNHCIFNGNGISGGTGFPNITLMDETARIEVVNSYWEGGANGRSKVIMYDESDELFISGTGLTYNEITDSTDAGYGHYTIMGGSKSLFGGSKWSYNNRIVIENESRLQKATNYNLAVKDSGTTIWCGTDGCSFLLPATVAGATFRIQNYGSTDGTVEIELAPQAADKIMGGQLAGTDDKARINTKATSQLGDLIEVTGDGTDGWYVTKIRGVWAEES